MKWILAFLFLLNFITGLSLLNEGLFHCDSVFLAEAVEKTYATGVLQPAYRGRFGSVIVNLALYYPFFLLGQNADFALRVSSILFHSLSIVVLFLLVSELLGNRLAAFFTAWLFSFTPLYLIPNTYGKEHGLSNFVFLLSLYLLSQAFTRRSLLICGISSFLLACSVTIRESMLAVIPLYFFLYGRPAISFHPLRVIIPKERRSLKWLSAAFVPFLLALIFSLRAYLGSVIYDSVMIENFASSNFMGFFSPVFPYALRDFCLAIPLSLLVFSVTGVVMMLRNRRIFIVVFFLFWFAFLFYFGNVSCYAPRYLDIPGIAVYVFASYALSLFYRKYKLGVWLLFLCCIVYMLILILPLLVFRHGYNGEKQFAFYVARNTEPNAVVIAMDDAPFIEYYAKRKTLNHPIENQNEIDAFIAMLKKQLEGDLPIYLIGSGLSYDPHSNFRESFFNSFNLELVGRKLAEDYHRPELQFQTYEEELLRVTLKKR
jgi:hypothetical protein